MKDVPMDKVKEFEREFIETLEVRHNEVLKGILKGNLDEEITKKLEKVAHDVAAHFTEDKEE